MDKITYDTVQYVERTFNQCVNSHNTLTEMVKIMESNEFCKKYLDSAANFVSIRGMSPEYNVNTVIKLAFSNLIDDVSIYMSENNNADNK